MGVVATDAEGRVLGAVVALADVTAQRELEAALAAADARVYQVKASRRSRGRGRLAAVPQR